MPRRRESVHAIINVIGDSTKISLDYLGYPIHPDKVPPAYNHIVRFDIRRLEKLCLSYYAPLQQEWYINHVAYWDDAGNYVEPVKELSYFLSICNHTNYPDDEYNIT
jgi:hypothetical protein